MSIFYQVPKYRKCEKSLWLQEVLRICVENIKEDGTAGKKQRKA